MKRKSAEGKAAVFVGTGRKLEIRTYDVKEPKAGYVRLSLLRSGICGTDVHILNGRLPLNPPFIPGHEFIGSVEALGAKADADSSGRKLKKGDAVIACAGVACGKCFNCRSGETASCLNFSVDYIQDPGVPPHFYGGYSEYLFCRAKALVRLPKGLDLDAVAAFACAGPTIIRALDFAGGLRKGEIVVVQGTGPVGLFAIAWAAKAGCTVLAIGSSSRPERTKLAKKLGAKHLFDYRNDSTAAITDRVRAIAKRAKRGDGADVVIESSGSPSAIPQGLEILRTLGRHVIPGQYSNSGSVEIQPQLITFKALKLIGSGQYKLSDIEVYLKFLRDDPDVQKAFAGCITHKYRIAEANKAMENAAAGKSVKGVFVP